MTGDNISILIDGILDEIEDTRNLNNNTQTNDESVQVVYFIETNSESDEVSK